MKVQVWRTSDDLLYFHIFFNHGLPNNLMLPVGKDVDFSDISLIYHVLIYAYALCICICNCQRSYQSICGIFLSRFFRCCFQSFHFWSRLVWKYISLRLASLNSAGIYSPETLNALLDADVQRQRILSTSLLFLSISYIYNQIQNFKYSVNYS